MTFTIQSVNNPPDMLTITTTSNGSLQVNGEGARYTGTSASFTGLQSKKHYKVYFGGNLNNNAGTGIIQINDTSWATVVYHTLHSTVPAAGVGKTTLSMVENAGDPCMWECDIHVCSGYTLLYGKSMFYAVAGAYVYGYRFCAYWASALAITKIALVPTAGTLAITSSLCVESVQ